MGLSVPLARQWASVRRLAVPICISLLVGSTAALLTALGIGWLLGLSSLTLVSLIPKSVTAQIAMGIAQQIGGIPPLSAVFSVVTGVVGASLGKYVFLTCLGNFGPVAT